jgi:CheY-like chemotaxis protein
VTTILVVDDEPTLRGVVAELLREEGYTVIEVGNALAALDALEHTRPDLVLMDVMMPGMDGPTAFLRMRAHPNGDTVPIVLTSAMAHLNHLPPDVSGFLRKPFEVESLLALVARFVAPTQTSDS